MRPHTCVCRITNDSHRELLAAAKASAARGSCLPLVKKEWRPQGTPFMGKLINGQTWRCVSLLLLRYTLQFVIPTGRIFGTPNLPQSY
jgi:hypothetical protein